MRGSDHVVRAARGVRVVLAALVLLCALAATAQAATLSGTVGYGRGAEVLPLFGATVTVTDPARRSAVATATSDAIGGYAALVADGIYDVTVEAPGYDAKTFAAVDLRRPRTLDATLTMPGQVRLVLTVLDADGPVARATVHRDSITAVTDAAGRAELFPRAGTDTLTVYGPRWAYQSFGVTISGDLTATVTAPEETVATVRVRDDDAGDPVVGADVWMTQATVDAPAGSSPFSGRFWTWSANQSTDRAGEARFSLFTGASEPGRQAYVTRPDDRYDDGAFGLGVVAADALYEVIVRRFARVTGTLSIDGEPISDASVNAGGDWQTTAADGSFALRAHAASTDTLSAWAPDGGGWFELTTALDGSDGQVLDLRLPRRSPATVQVDDEAGRGVEGAWVLVPWMSGTVDLGDGRDGTIAQGRMYGYTDAAGTIAFPLFPGVSGAGHDLGRVSPPAGRALSTEWFELDPAGTTVVLRDLAPSATLDGVLTALEMPVARATVRLGEETVTTDGGGAFSFTVDPGTYRLEAEWTGRDGSRNTFVVPALDVSRDRILPLALSDRLGHGVRLRDPDGRAVAGARVTLPAYVGSGGPDLPDGAELTIEPPVLESDATGEVIFELPDDGLVVPTGAGAVEPPRGSGLEPASFSARPGWGILELTLERTRAADTTAPEIVCDGAPSALQSANVAIGCTASDAGSGLADPADAAFSLTTDVPAGSEEAAAYTGRREVCDVAGNCATAGPLGPVAVDRAAPQITLDVAPAPQVRGDWWTVSRVAVQVTVTDALAGPATVACSVDGVARTFAQTRTATTFTGTFYVNVEGRHVAGCTAVDRLGHSGSATRQVNLDLKAPAAPTLTPHRAPEDPVGGWWRGGLPVYVTDNGDPALADGTPGSGVDPASYPESLGFGDRGDGRSGVFTASATVTDMAGRVSAAGRLTVKVDRVPPTSTLTCPAAPVKLGTSATARWQDADQHSGLAGSASGTQALRTGAVGGSFVEHVATDRVGYETTSACRYRVVYPFVLRGGLAAPPAFNAVAPGVSTRTVHFSIGGDHGLGIVPRGGVTVQPVSCSDGSSTGPEGPATLSGPLAYDPVTGRYAVAWDAGRDLPAGSCAALRIGLDDDTVNAVLFAA